MNKLKRTILFILFLPIAIIAWAGFLMFMGAGWILVKTGVDEVYREGI